MSRETGRIIAVGSSRDRLQQGVNHLLGLYLDGYLCGHLSPSQVLEDPAVWCRVTGAFFLFVCVLFSRWSFHSFVFLAEGPLFFVLFFGVGGGYYAAQPSSCLQTQH